MNLRHYCDDVNLNKEVCERAKCKNVQELPTYLFIYIDILGTHHSSRQWIGGENGVEQRHRCGLGIL